MLQLIGNLARPRMALSSNAAVPAVQVCLEAPQEATVREVTLDGQELYAQQLTMSDNVTRLAQRIDFQDQGTFQGYG